MEAEVGVTGAEEAEVVVTDSGEAEVVVTDSAAEVLAVINSAAEVLAVMDSAAEVLAVMVLVGEVLAHPAQVSAGAVLVRDSAGRADLRVEVFLIGQIAVASVIAVSVGEIAAFATVDFAISKGTLSILASMALDIQITTNTTIPITTHTRITTTIPIQASIIPWTTEGLQLAT
jgi:hypothetical protein